MTTDPLTIDGLGRSVFFGAAGVPSGHPSQRAVVDLCTCMGEPVERLESDDPTVIGYLRAARPDPD